MATKEDGCERTETSFAPGSLQTAKMFFDDVPVGETFTTGSRTVTEADVVNFAGLRGEVVVEGVWKLIIRRTEH